MKSGDPLLTIDVVLPPRSSRRRTQSLYSQLRHAIVDGRLATGVRLPATRQLAQQLGASRNMVVAVYDRLVADGYLRARRGSGFEVSGTFPRVRAAAPRARTAVVDRRLVVAFRGALPRVPPFPAPPVRYDFRIGVPDVNPRHLAAWRRVSARVLRRLEPEQFGYGSVRGQASLRSAIATHVSFARGIACLPDDVLVTGGAQQAFDLLARTLVTPRETVVAVEDPGYAPATAAFEAAGARIVPVPVDDDGLVVAALPPDARLICVTPSHQFPLGSVLSLERRLALLEHARRHRALVVEDDYDGEFRYDGRSLDALQTLDRADSVCYVGTFSKSLFPALRLGFAVAPAWLRRPLLAAKRHADWHCNVLAQETLAAYVAGGDLARHVRRMRGIYAERRARLLARLARDCADSLEIVPSGAGLHVTARVRPHLDAERIVQRARERGVGIYSTAPYGRRSDVRPALMFGFGAIESRDVLRGLAVLQEVLRESR